MHPFHLPLVVFRCEAQHNLPAPQHPNMAANSEELCVGSPRMHFASGNLCHLFDLPPEVRKMILVFAIDPDETLTLGTPMHQSSQKNVINLFLASKQLYYESAAIFYEHVEINCWPNDDIYKRFLTSKFQPQTLVRTLRIHFQIMDNLPLFETFICNGIRSMLDVGRLKALEVIIGTKGARNITWDYQHCLPRRRIRLARKAGKGSVTHAFLSGRSFQAFLKLLKEPRFDTVTVWIEKDLHLDCWCPFHACQDDEGQEEDNDEETQGVGACSLYKGYRPLLKHDFLGDWPLLKLDWERLVDTYLGAKAVRKRTG